MSSFVSPTGYVELDNDCNYSIDLKSTRSREEINPKEDLAFYFDTYIVPKYGLNNLNVNNVASFMKDLEMNWTKIDPSLKSKVLDIMVDGILSKNTSFKEDLLAKLGASAIPAAVEATPILPSLNNISSFSNIKNIKSGFGATTNNNYFMIFLGLLFVIIIFVIFNKSKMGGYPKFR